MWMSALALPALLIMWSLLLVSAVMCYTSANIMPEDVVFNKCCPKHQSLIKYSNIDNIYQCINTENANNNYNISIYPLVVGDSVSVKYGLPINCDQIQMTQMTSITVDDFLTNSEEFCYDRLELKIVNNTVKPYIPKIVALSCAKNDTHHTSKTNLINQLRKCCPRGQSYDSNFHLCRNTDTNNTEDWIINHLGINHNYIYEVDHGLNCKSSEYGVELKEDFFSLEVYGSYLNIFNRKKEISDEILPGEWCIDRDYASQNLIARICTSDCLKYGAFCLKKCCPVGYHYRPRRCGTFVSTCTRTTDDLPFNITEYLNPLEKEESRITDILGFGSELQCSDGRIVLNKSLVKDHHQLDRAGRLISAIHVGYDYCLETFDVRWCNETPYVSAASCFIRAPKTKNFHISFIMICISIVCLALTLLVYLSLPELRNLHGRTLICHVSMMLLAFGCLARVQYSLVADESACTLLGYGIYFGFVSAFAWLNVMCFDIWWTFGSVRTVQPMRKANAEFRRFLWYSLYAWSCSIFLTLTMFLFDKYPVSSYLDASIGEGRCWFGTIQNSKSDWPHYIYFVIPMGLVTCTNFVLWVLTARHCARVKSEVHRLQAGSVGDRAKRRFRVDRAKYVLTGKLWVVMGAGWISELLSTISSEPQWFWMIIDLINELQGVFIFLILVIKPKLYYLIRKRLGLEKPDAQKNGTSSSSARTSSTILSRALSTDDRTRLSLQNNAKQS